MTMLIVTGLPSTRLAEIEACLYQGGMARPLSVSAAPVPTADAWLDRVVPSSRLLEEPPAPGRVLELAAGDILLAHINQAFWGWADERHAQILEFWRDFEAQAQFLLVFADPASYLAERYRALGENLDVSDALAYWHSTTTRLLGFYLQNPTRCAAVMLSQWEKTSDAALDTLAARLSLHVPQFSVSLVPADPELHWLCGQLVSRDAPITQLWAEVEGLIGVPDSTDDEPGPKQAIFECLRRTRRLEGQAEALAHETALRLESDRRLAASEVRLSQMTATLQAAEADARSQAVALDGAKRQARSDTEAFRVRIRDLPDEHLAKRQEIAALERQLAEFAAAAQANAKKTTGHLQGFEREKRLLMEQLHQVQEELERAYLLNHALEDENSALKASFERMAGRSPALFDFESARISQDALGVLSIRFEALRVGAQRIPVLDTSFVAGDAGVALVIPSGQSMAPWTGLPGAPPLVFDTTQADDAPEHALAATLSTSIWTVIRALPAAAVTAMQEQGLADPRWQQSLSALRAMLDRPLRLWRWDQISLRNEQVNPDYEHLWIRLSGASFESARWPVFDFRIAAANVVGGAFSGHLKYEFPQQVASNPQFECWRADVQDELGARFELRFDLARDAFDLETWRSLTSTDHQRFAGLLLALPTMLQALQGQGCTISRPWRDWEELNRLAINVLLGIAQAAAEYG